MVLALGVQVCVGHPHKQPRRWPVERTASPSSLCAYLFQGNRAFRIGSKCTRARVAVRGIREYRSEVEGFPRTVR